MKTSRTHHFLLLTALFHLFADVAFAGGAVFCVGPNDHSAVELGHLAPGCETIEVAQAQQPNAGLANESCTSCTDSPLHTEAEIASERMAWDAGTAMAVLDAISVRQRQVVVNRLPICHRIDLSMRIRAHRSIVLTV